MWRPVPLDPYATPSVITLSASGVITDNGHKAYNVFVNAHVYARINRAKLHYLPYYARPSPSIMPGQTW
eukprot:COSAG02_NODE_42536_length_383_cov_1.450704_1_plen_68_part_10